MTHSKPVKVTFTLADANGALVQRENLFENLQAAIHFGAASRFALYFTEEGKPGRHFVNVSEIKSDKTSTAKVAVLSNGSSIKLQHNDRAYNGYGHQVWPAHAISTSFRSKPAARP